MGNVSSPPFEQNELQLLFSELKYGQILQEKVDDTIFDVDKQLFQQQSVRQLDTANGRVCVYLTHIGEARVQLIANKGRNLLELKLTTKILASVVFYLPSS